MPLFGARNPIRRLDFSVFLCYTGCAYSVEERFPPSITLSEVLPLWRTDNGRTESRGGIPEWPKGTDCKSVAECFRGSNPLLPTIYKQGPAHGLDNRQERCSACFFALSSISVRPRPHSSAAEHFFGKEEVLGPIPSVGWTCLKTRLRCAFAGARTASGREAAPSTSHRRGVKRIPKDYQRWEK